MLITSIPFMSCTLEEKEELIALYDVKILIAKLSIKSSI